MIVILQIEQASEKLLEYGLLGVILIFVGFIAYKMYNKINEDQKIWRTEAIETRKDLTGLMVKQNELNTKLINIREKDVEQEKENFIELKKKLEQMPIEVKKELQVDLLGVKCNNSNQTSAG